MTVTSISFATKKFLCGMCYCTVDSNVGTGDFSPVLGILHVCGHADVRSHVSPGMHCCFTVCPVQGSILQKRSALNMLALVSSLSYYKLKKILILGIKNRDEIC